MTHALVVSTRGVNEGVRVGTEADLKALYPSVKAWQDFGYKQGASLTEYTLLELFRL